MQNIYIKNLCKSYQDNIILQDINLDIIAGDFIVLLGQSGCGKTTLLNILGGFENFNSGKIIINSNIGNFSPELEQEFTYTTSLHISPSRIKVPQNYVLIPWKNALNQITFAIKSRFKSMKKTEVKNMAMYYLELVGLEKHAHKFPHELSGGQQSRVNIARALSVKPEVLLMDEPFGALDSFTRENLQESLKNITNTLKTTCVFVTHDVEEALILGNKIIVMNAVTKNISLSLNMSKTYDRQDSYFHHLKGEIYENLKYPYMKKDYVI